MREVKVTVPPAVLTNTRPGRINIMLRLLIKP